MSESLTSPLVTPQRVTTQADRRRQEALTGFGFIAPALTILIVFLVIPLIAAGYFSLTDWNGITPLTREDAYQFVGLRNYERLLIEDGIRQERFFTAVKNTVYYVLGVVPTQTFFALILAVIVNQRWLRAKDFFRTAFYFPSITSSVVI